MHCTKLITDDLYWIGGNDRRLAMFEGVYSVPNGVSYNSYLLKDDITVLFDTVDKAVGKVFFENISFLLEDRHLDYVIIQHMEPDHSATLEELLIRYPDVKIICNSKTATMINQFFSFNTDGRINVIKEGDTFNTGHHTLNFIFAPMVHWPEVMVTYDSVDKILFSADAFGTFGALNGTIFADEVDFDRDYLDEARRYYCNIVGKYGPQVQMLLKKAAVLEINMLCPLHGFVWRTNLGYYIEKYNKWSLYQPEKSGVMIAYASIYGNTESAAEIVSSKLRDNGFETVMFDVSVTPASEIIAAAFKWSHLVFAAPTYNTGVFISMEELLRDLAAHNIQNRTVAFIENGSWAPTIGKIMKEILSNCKNLEYIENLVSIRSSLKAEQNSDIISFVDAIADTLPKANPLKEVSLSGSIEPETLFKLQYGLYVVTSESRGKTGGCIINTVTQLTDSPKRITIAVNNQNFTQKLIAESGIFNISVLSNDVPFDIVERFGFQSSEFVNKFDGLSNVKESKNGLKYLDKFSNAFMSARVIGTYDYGTHTLFVAELTEASVLSDKPSVTYEYYLNSIKPKPQVQKKKAWVCKICGYVYEGDELPADFICPLCKHGAKDFELME